MQGYKSLEPKLIYLVTLEELVPKYNFYRKLAQEIDFQFLYKQTEKYYGKEGQESIDPVVFFKILIVGYLNNIVSDRRLIEYCSNCLDIRLFIKYDIDEKLPWHSTISRTRQLYGEEVFLKLFQQILTKCVEKGMVGGKRQAVDSAYIKANASMDSLQMKEIYEDVSIYATQFNEESEYKVNASEKLKADQNSGIDGNQNQAQTQSKPERQNVSNEVKSNHSKSNKTHYSPTDEDSRISTKPGKQCLLNYSGQIVVDDEQHLIVGAMADFADKRDSQSLESIVEQTQNNLSINNIEIGLILADGGYSSAESLSYLNQKQIDALIPNHGQYKPSREGFLFNEELDQYECQRGNLAILDFRGFQQDKAGNEYKIYRSQQSICKSCPLRVQCCGNKTMHKKILHTAHKALFDRMHERYKMKDAKNASKIRSRTVEPVLGSLINYFGLKKVNSKGIDSATKHCLMSSLCYNLKKMMKFIMRNVESDINSLKILPKINQNDSFFNLNLLLTSVYSSIFICFTKPVKSTQAYSNEKTHSYQPIWTF